MKQLISLFILSTLGTLLYCNEKDKKIEYNAKKILILQNTLSISDGSLLKVSGQIVDMEKKAMENAIFITRSKPEAGISIPLLFIHGDNSKISRNVISDKGGAFDLLLIPGQYIVEVQSPKEEPIGGFFLDIEKDATFVEAEIWENSQFNINGNMVISNLEGDTGSIAVESSPIEMESSPPNQASFLENPSFEDDTNSCSKNDDASLCPKGWSITTSGLIEVSQNKVTAQDGTHVLGFSSLTGSYSGRMALSNCFPLDIQKNLEAKGYLLKTADENIRGRFVVTFFKDDYCTTYSGSTINGSGTSPNLVDTWEELNITINLNQYPSEPKVYGKLGIQATKPTGTQGDVYFDNINVLQK
ncbi:MAG: hypothetical protein H7A23_12265 [Leptospiraceae bacterium]|nr:hypothetical protein [Leptospiraceae bacterium]MCP5495322.1 hypothetical protein [Leptospiraceae bacterium]